MAKRVKEAVGKRGTIERPRFNSCFRVDVRSPDLVVLISENGCLGLSGRLHPLLAPLIDGKRTANEIAELLEGRATPLDVDFGLSVLEQYGCIEESRDETDAPSLAWMCDCLGLPRRDFEARLEAAKVAVRVFGQFSAAPFISALESLGLSVTEEARFAVALVDDYLTPELEEFHREAVACRMPWLIAKPAGATAWIGPVFDLAAGACWPCLATRLRTIRRSQAILPERRPEDDLRPPAPAPAPALHAALQLTALETLKWVLRQDDSELHRQMLTLDFRTMRLEAHAVVRQEGCPDCASPALGSDHLPPPLRLEGRPKVFLSDGGHRSTSLEEVCEKFGHHVSPITGIVSRLEPYGPRWPGLPPAFLADHLFVPETDGASGAGGRARRKSSGKGMTDLQARVSALCEALERYSGVFRGNEPRRTARYEDLGELAIHSNGCLHFSRRQYAERQVWNRRGRPELWTPMPFDERLPIEWSPVWSLTEGRYKYVPTAYCYYGYPVSQSHDFCRADSNGCAAGTCPEEAILQGFLELVERDAVALWWYNRIPRQAVHPANFRLPYFREFWRHYLKLGRQVRLFDITSDVPIPVFAAVSWPQAAQRELILGFGAHFDPELAASRALSEMNQFLHFALAGKPRCRLEEPLDDNSFLFSEQGGTLSAGPGWSDDLRDDVEAAIELARGRGLEVLVLDQTRSDIGLHVVKVMVPGLRHFWPRFGAGRLFDVPVQMGWLGQPIAEEDLNRVFLIA